MSALYKLFSVSRSICIYFFYMLLIVLQSGHGVINQNVCKPEFWNRDACFMYSFVNMLHQEIPTFSFYLDWFTLQGPNR